MQKLLKLKIKFLIIYITTPKFNKLTAEIVPAKLKQADLVNKAGFDNKLTSFDKRIN